MVDTTNFSNMQEVKSDQNPEGGGMNGNQEESTEAGDSSQGKGSAPESPMDVEKSVASEEVGENNENNSIMEVDEDANAQKTTNNDDVAIEEESTLVETLEKDKVAAEVKKNGEVEVAVVEEATKSSVKCSEATEVGIDTISKDGLDSKNEGKRSTEGGDSLVNDKGIEDKVDDDVVVDDKGKYEKEGDGKGEDDKKGDGKGENDKEGDDKGEDKMEVSAVPLEELNGKESNEEGNKPVDGNVEADGPIVSPNVETDKADANITDKEAASTEAAKPAAEESDSDDDRPTIFIRNLRELVESQESDEDDDIIILDMPNDEPSGKSASSKEITGELEDKSDRRVYPPPMKTRGRQLSDMVTYYNNSHNMDMICDEKVDPEIVDDHQIKMDEYRKTKGSFLRIKKALEERKKQREMISAQETLSQQIFPIRMTPPVPRSALTAQPYRFPQASNIRPAGRQMQTSIPPVNQQNIVRVSMPGLAPITIIRTTASAPMPGTVGQGVRIRHTNNTMVSSMSATPRLATTISSNSPQGNVVNVQQMPQLIFDPSTGLLLCQPNQAIIRTQQGSQVTNSYQIPPRLNSPHQTIRLQNGMIIRPQETTFNNKQYNSMRDIGNQILNVSTGVQIPSPVQVQRVSTPSAVSYTGNQYPRQTNQRMAQPLATLQTSPVRVQRYRGPAPLQRLPPPPPPVNISRVTPPIPQPRPVTPDSALRVNGPPAVVPTKQVTNTASSTDSSGVTAGNQKPMPGTVDESDPDLQNKTFPSLVVHVKTCLRAKTNRQIQVKARTDLDAAVKSVLIYTPAKFTEWLLRRGVLRLEHFCDLATHRNPNTPFKLGMYSDGNRQPFSGGYVWTSDCCPDKQISVFNGSVYEGSKYPPGTVLKLIYHWSCQTPASNILQWVKVSSLYLKNFFTLLRAVCISWLHEQCPPLGGEMKFVEIGVITLGSSAETSRGVKNVNVEILGVFDPATKIVRMKVINSLQGLYKDKGKAKQEAHDQGARAFQILWPLTHWVDKRSILLVDGIIDRSLFHELGFKNIQQCGENLLKNSPTNVNIMNYLRHVVPKMFSSTLSVLSKSIVQQFLDELSWREAYGNTVLETYDHMLDHIAGMTKWNTGEPLIARLNKVNQNPFADWSYTKQIRRSPLNTIPITLRNEPGIRECIRHIMKDEVKSTVPTNHLPPPPPVKVPTAPANSVSHWSNSSLASHVALKRKQAELTTSSNVAYYKSHYAVSLKEVSLQRYYYGHVGPHQVNNLTNTQMLAPFTQNLKCPLCVRVFASNLEILRHIVMHVAGLPRTSENSLCVYCLKELTSGDMLQHFKQVHRLDSVTYACRICEEKFLNDLDLTIHMWDLHVEAECPYICDVCNYSSAFHHEVVEHFNQEHSNISCVMCPHCLKALPAKSLANLKTIVVHLQSHQLKRAKKCGRCVLSFGNELDLHSHVVSHYSRKTEGKMWQPYTLSPGEADILMCWPPKSKSPISSLSSKYPPQKKQKLNQAEKAIKKTLNTSFSVPINTNEKFGGSKYKMNIPNVERGKAICMECSGDITSPNHYIGRLICTKCRYITACQAAMELHHIRNHQQDSKHVQSGIPTKKVEMLVEPMTCKCGFHTRNPYKLSNHLVRCEKPTAYPKTHTPLCTEVPPTLPREQDSPITSGSKTSRAPVSPKGASMENGDIFSLDNELSFSTSLEAALSLPPILSPSAPMPQSPLTAFDSRNPDSSSQVMPQSTTTIDDASSAWDPDTWELPLSGLIAK